MVSPFKAVTKCLPRARAGAQIPGNLSGEAMRKTKTYQRFFDRREPCQTRYAYQEEMCISFNAAHKIGTAIRVYPMARWLVDCHKDTVVAEPGAFVNSAGHAVVKVPGDCIALTHVEPLSD